MSDAVARDPHLPAVRTGGGASAAPLPGGRDGEADDFDENFADSAQVAAEQGEHAPSPAHSEDQLDEVEAALARIDDGTYGLCEAGGEPIPAARLEAMPATRFCIDHA